MKLIEAEKQLQKLSTQKRVFRSRELGRVFNEKGEALRSTIKRLVLSNLITRIARDVYWFAGQPQIFSQDAASPIEEIASALRKGELNYIGLESAASLWGIISQIPIDRLTVVTTGRAGEFTTPFGVIEFVHTSASPETIMQNTVDYPGHTLRLAKKKFAAKDLVKSRRSTYLIDWEEVEDAD